MDIICECEDKVGAKSYETIIKDILRQYAPFFKQIHVYVDVKEPMFIIHASWIKRPKIVLKEIATIEAYLGEVKIELKDGFKHRVYEVFEVLKSVYGEERVDQKNYAVIVKNAKPQDLESFVADFNEKTVNDTIDVIMRIIPEGFKVTRILSDHSGLTLISSENPLKNEWIKKAERIQKLSE